MGREKRFKLLFITYNCVDLNFLPTFLRTTYGFYNITEIQTAQDIYLQTPIYLRTFTLVIIKELYSENEIFLSVYI